MVSRLVLGCGSVGRILVDALGDRPGGVTVLCTDEHRVETLRSDRVAARRADPTDPATLADLDKPVDVVVVASDDPATNEAAATAARETHPNAFVLAYTGEEPTDDRRFAIESIADRTITSATTAATELLERIGEESMRPRRLWRVLRTIDGPLAIVTHDNPDPDAIASALALRRIAAAAGCDAEVCYFGAITHQQNRAMVNLLDIEMRELAPDDIDEYGGIALVDHSRPGVNDQLPEDTPIDVLIDHHPPRAPVEARFVDLRSDVGATSTLLVDYLGRLGIEIDSTVATALLYGIRVDTKDFQREVSTVDFDAAAFLLPYADEDILEQVETPSMSAETLETIARAISNREVSGSVLVSYIDDLHERDALAQAADQLLDIEDIRTTLVYGIIDGTIYCSGRTRGGGLDIGETLRDAFDRIGSAGGHADMAGAQLPLGLLGDADETALSGIVHDVINDRFFGAIESRPDVEPTTTTPDVTAGATELAGADETGEAVETNAGDGTSRNHSDPEEASGDDDERRETTDDG
ncbi:MULTISPECIES: DHH family phosphoesterase [Halococcus]|uniref:Phosphoesterase RecJ domain-containing protein n=1 Tax=Halococcus salifodinae DSM 8989 TaxID=1227456 RepID=M0MWV6_9EURY|nr:MULTISPECIES: DHHA1 domain-containing protein [Halococcus]EMA49319.1 phosphoesterase RecJ domain-containing protein [Halococcus salifodinae DSM 8989]